MINHFIFGDRNRIVFFFAAAVSVILSILIYYQQPIINPDGICYLLSASEVGSTGILSAMNLCGQAKWPFYSILIYGLANLSHLSYLFAAYLLDAAFSLLIVITFILLIKALGGRGRILWLAAGVILLAHSVNGVREYIIRDHGFWSFYLISTLLLLRYVERPTFSRAFIWSLSTGVAALFRVEGLIFLVVIPFLSMFYPDHTFKQKVKGLLGFYFLLILSGVMIASWLIYHPTETLEKFGRLTEILYQMHHGLMLMFKRYQEIQIAVANHVLTKDATEQAGLFLVLVFISWYLILVFSNLSWVYFLLLLYALKAKVLSLCREAKFVIYSYLGLNIIITFSFLLERHFLSKRYLIALSLILMLPLPFALNHILLRSSQLRYRLFMLIIIILTFITIRNDFSVRGSKGFIQDAGRFIALTVPAKASLYINDYQLMYYSAHFDKQIFNEYYRQLSQKQAIAAGDFKQYDFLALRINKKDQFAFSHLNKLLPLKTFMNKRGDKVIIYQTDKKASTVVLAIPCLKDPCLKQAGAGRATRDGMGL